MLLSMLSAAFVTLGGILGALTGSMHDAAFVAGAVAGVGIMAAASAVQYIIIGEWHPQYLLINRHEGEGASEDRGQCE